MSNCDNTGGKQDISGTRTDDHDFVLRDMFWLLDDQEVKFGKALQASLLYHEISPTVVLYKQSAGSEYTKLMLRHAVSSSGLKLWIGDSSSIEATMYKDWSCYLSTVQKTSATTILLLLTAGAVRSTLARHGIG